MKGGEEINAYKNAFLLLIIILSNFEITVDEIDYLYSIIDQSPKGGINYTECIMDRVAF